MMSGIGNGSRSGGGKLTTHVLDIAMGRPAKGVEIDLHRMDSNSKVFKIASGKTNNDGRLPEPIISGSDFYVGTYQITFHVEKYLKLNFKESTHKMFLRDIPIQFYIATNSEHYHVPLLLSPFGYSTYRGS